MGGEIALRKEAMYNEAKKWGSQVPGLEDIASACSSLRLSPMAFFLGELNFKSPVDTYNKFTIQTARNMREAARQFDGMDHAIKKIVHELGDADQDSAIDLSKIFD